MFIAIIIIIVALAFFMEIGAIILKMTGLEMGVARFQALSALTSTGFTTKEAEAIMKHPLRRKVIMTLMIIGNAGLVSIIFTIVTTGNRSLNFVQIAISLALLVLVIRLITDRWLIGVLDRKIEATLEKHQLLIRKKTIEEVLHLGDTYGVAEVNISQNSELLGLTLAEAGLTEKNILVLAIERNGDFIHMPRSFDRFFDGDTLLVYGNLKSLRQLLGEEGAGDERSFG